MDPASLAASKVAEHLYQTHGWSYWKSVGHVLAYLDGAHAALPPCARDLLRGSAPETAGRCKAKARKWTAAQKGSAIHGAAETFPPALFDYNDPRFIPPTEPSFLLRLWWRWSDFRDRWFGPWLPGVDPR